MRSASAAAQAPPLDVVDPRIDAGEEGERTHHEDERDHDHTEHDPIVVRVEDQDNSEKDRSSSVGLMKDPEPQTRSTIPAIACP